MNQMKSIRLKKAIKQVDIAKATGLSKASISLYESGKNNPSLNNALKVSRVLGVTVEELFNRNEVKSID